MKIGYSFNYWGDTSYTFGVSGYCDVSLRVIPPEAYISSVCDSVVIENKRLLYIPNAFKLDEAYQVEEQYRWPDELQNRSH